jgi:hypothetical protein
MFLTSKEYIFPGSMTLLAPLVSIVPLPLSERLAA